MSVRELEAKHEQELKELEEEKERERSQLAPTAGAAAKKKFESRWKTKMEEVARRQETELWEAKMSETVDDEEEQDQQVSSEQVKKEEEKKKEEQRKQKNAKKKQKKNDKLNQARQQAEQEFLDEGGITQREVEIQRIKQYLDPTQSIHDVDADGHCLYRSLAHQLNINLEKATNPFTKELMSKAQNCLSEKNKRELKSMSNNSGFTYLHLRSLIASQLRKNPDNYFPFVMDVCETMDQYADLVDGSSEWGGQVELQAFLDLCNEQYVLKIAQDNGIVTMGSSKNSQCPSESTLMVSYHKRYYALGEHYNSVVTDVKQD